jgi:hypothetical protein
MYQCVIEGCKNAAIFDTNICNDCLEIAAIETAVIESAMNMGQPEVVRCGHCEEWFTWDGLVTHHAVLMDSKYLCLS